MRKYTSFMPRTITILIYLPMLVFAFYLGSLPFFIIALLSSFLAINEMLSMYKSYYKREPDYFLLAFVFSVLLLTSAYMIEYKAIWDNAAFMVLSLFAVLFFLYELKREKILLIENSLFFTIRTIIYVGLFYSYGVLLRELPQGLNYILFLFGVVWVNDIFAYLIGIPLGRHPLSPKVSPKKSIEGAAGALLGATLMAVTLKDLIGIDLTHAVWVGIGISLSAQSGDLIESLLKREFKIKDSGSFFPGHGGILDRMDSIVIVLPLFFYYLKYFIR